MEQTITLSINNPSVRIPVRKEQPYFEITRVILPSDEEFLKSIKAVEPVVNCRKIKGAQKEEEFLIFSAADRDGHSRDLYFKEVMLSQNDSDCDHIEIYCDFQKFSIISSFEVCYSVLPPLISLDTLFDDFSDHLNDPGNCKILFSAPFGQGKTTFLKEYFNEHSQQYEVFHLFPVNYSVASNEDIFRYIKCELIFQLFERNVEFEKIETTFKDALPFYLLKHPLKVIQPLIHLIPKIGGSLVKFLESTEKLGASMKKYAEAHSVDERNDAEQYTKDIFEQEGSIYEDNFYTQLIKQLVEQLHEHGKTTVFIIDDLDRMDPEHIFRIMNVLAAHFDGPEYQMNHHSNKFGFDKIILVADYENLKKIFCHKYGPRTDYKGYIDKFFSKRIYQFESKELQLAAIQRYSNMADLSENVIIMIQILKDLISTNSISLRELLQINKIRLSYLRGKIELLNSDDPVKIEKIFAAQYFSRNLFLQIYYFSSISGIDHTINMFENCFESVSQEAVVENSELSRFYKEHSYNCMISLLPQERLAPERLQSYDYHKQLFSFYIAEKGRHYFFSKSHDTGQPFPLGVKDFYELLILVAKKYKEVGGLTGEKVVRNG